MHMTRAQMSEEVMSFLSFALYVLCTWTVIGALLPLARAWGIKKQNTRTKLPPGPAPLPVIGNLFQLGNKPHKSMAELAKTHGPIMTLRFPPNKTAVVISSAAMAKQALQKQDASFSSHRTVPDCVRACGHDAVSVVWLPAASQKWRNLHKICNSHIFTPRVLGRNRDLRRQKVQELLGVVGESCSAGSGIAVGKLAFMTSLNLLSDTVLSRDWVDLRSDAAQELKEAAWGIMEEVGRTNLADYFPVLSRIDPQGIRRRLTAHFRIFLEVFESAIEQRIHVREQQPVRRPNTDVLDILINNVHDGTDLSLNDMRHLLLDLFIAGSETTSSTVEWAMAELLRNPTTLATVQAEIMEQTIGKGNPELEEEDVARLPYLRAVVKETFRLHPAVPLLLPRRVDEEVEICGYNIPKDTQVLVNAWAIGRDPETWEDPNSFRPERFMGLDMDVKGQSFELIPFGAGRRRCPGLPLAVRMVHLLLGSLIHAFEWKLEDGVTAETMDMEEMFGLTLQKAQPLVAIPLHH